MAGGYLSYIKPGGKSAEAVPLHSKAGVPVHVIQQCPSLTRQIKDEDEAIKMYEGLARTLEKLGYGSMAKQIRSIGADEDRHRQMLGDLEQQCQKQDWALGSHTPEGRPLPKKWRR